RRACCRRIWLAICRLFFRGLRFGLAGGLLGFVVRLSSSPGCFLICVIYGFLCFSRYGFAGFFRFLPYGLRSLFCFFADRFSSLFCFLTYCFQSVFDCFPCFLRAVLYVLNHTLLDKRSQRRRRNQSSNQTRNFHVPFLLLILPTIGSDQAA